VVILLAALAVGYVLFAAVGDALLSRQLDQDEQRLQREIVELRRQQRELESIRDYLRTDEYIEGVARRVLGLVRPGETLYIVSSSATPAPEPDQPSDEEEEPDPEPRRPWWEVLYGP
jgi:cell division protein FtsB